MDLDRTARIRALNDALRACFQRGRWMITRGITELGPLFVFRVVEAVKEFDRFEQGDDPYSEHDFGAMEVNGIPVFWKIDYYDETLKAGAEDPSDAERTARVITLMLAEEY